MGYITTELHGLLSGGGGSGGSGGGGKNWPGRVMGPIKKAGCNV